MNNSNQKVIQNYEKNFTSPEMENQIVDKWSIAGRGILFYQINQHVFYA